jgi:hypothetical protein
LFLDADGPTVETVTSPAPVSSPRPWIPGSLVRQNPLRRQNRSRISDFNEFTHQRRSMFRASAQTDDDDRSNPYGFSPSQRPRDLPIPVEHSNHLRFLPLAALADPQYHPENGIAGTSDDRTTMPAGYWYHYPHFTQLPPFPPPSSGTAGSHSNASTIPPRLRRGGLRAPETLIQPHDTSQNTPSSSLATSNVSDSLLALSHIPGPSTVPLPVIVEHTAAISADEANNETLPPSLTLSVEEDSY